MEQNNSQFLTLDADANHTDFNTSFEFKEDQAVLVHYPGENVKIEVVVFLCVAFTSVLVNLRVLCITVESPKKSLSRPLSVFFIQMCVMGISFSFLITLLVAENTNLITIFSGPVPCRLFSFLRSTLLASYTLTIVGIFYVVVQTLSGSATKLLIWRAITLIWVVAAIYGFPALFTVQYVVNTDTDVGKCNQKNLMGSATATVTLEIFKFIFIHLLVSIYICYALYSIRSKLRFLYVLKRIPRKGVDGAVRCLRFVYLYSILFVSMWLPSGIVMALYRILLRVGVDASRLPGWISLLTFTHLNNVLIPVFFLYLNNNMSEVYAFAYVFLCKSGCETDPVDHAHTNTEVGENDFVEESAV